MILTDKYILRLTVGCLAVGLGIPGNATSIALFWRLGIRNATDVTFIALSIIDLIASVINGTKIAMVFLHDEHPWACFIEVIATRSALYAGLYLTTTIAVYRYQAVCKPFASRIGRRAAAWISLMCAVVAFGQHVPFFFITRSRQVGNNYSCNVYGNIDWIRDVYANAQAAIFYLSAIAVTVLYIRIYRVIRSSQVIRRKMMTGTLSECSQSGQTESTVSIPTISSHVTISSSFFAVDTSTENDVDNNAKISAQTKESTKREMFRRKETTSALTSSRHQSDHKTTQTLTIIAAILFSLWLPNVVLDQLPFEQIKHISTSIPSGSFLVYFLYQVKYLVHITNVFIYLWINRRFRQTCLKLYCGR